MLVDLVPLMEERGIVAFSTSQTCHLLGQNQLDARILGQDGGRSILHNGVSYWTFGDTLVDQPPYDGQWEEGVDRQITNSLAVGSDVDASDCIVFSSKVDGSGEADVVLPKDSDLSEVAAWPSGWVKADATETAIYHYYSSVKAVPGGVKGQGSGLARMNIASLSSSRIPATGGACDNVATCLFWKEAGVSGSCTFDIGAAHPVREGNLVYVFLETQGSVGVARVLYAQIENLSAYQYWNGSTWVTGNPCAMYNHTLWEQPTGFQGLEVTFNTHLQKYVAVYASGYLGVIYARTADYLWGPWSDADGLDQVYGLGDVMVLCGDFLVGVPTVREPPPGQDWLCYGGLQHPHLEKAEGGVIYVSYSNSRSYRVYLQEVVLGTAIYQYSDAAGHTAYRREGVSGPAGFTKDGVAFYAYHDSSNCTDGSLQDVYDNYDILRVYEWRRGTDEYAYTTGGSPGSGFVFQGVAFCATDPEASETGYRVPIRQWDEGELHILSGFDVSPLNLEGGDVAFYARVTRYNDFGPQEEDGLWGISHAYDGGYRRCMGVIPDEPGLLPAISMDVYCYTDVPGVDINPEGYPGWEGDGLPGAPPPGPDTINNPQHPEDVNLVFGDVNSTHTALSGSLNGSTVTVSGCFVDQDGQDPLGDIYVEWSWDVQTGVGSSEMWTGQCSSAGGGVEGLLSAIKLATTTQLDACYAGNPPTCPYADNDPLPFDSDGDGILDRGDGVPDHKELQNDTDCGLRDPFNPNDYGDVSVPRDSVIDLSNDILGVILEYAPGGYVSGTVDYTGNTVIDNYDRGGIIQGSVDHWNRSSPDGVIDLSNDVLGVILQYNPGGC